MKRLIVVLLFIWVPKPSLLCAQDAVKVSVLGKNAVTVVEANGQNTDVKVVRNSVRVIDGREDTLKIRVGRRALIISDGGHGSSIRFEHLDDQEFSKWTSHTPKFKGHWTGFEMGVNSFANANYNGNSPNFMDLNHNKSFEAGINFLQYDIGFQRNLTNTGIVTGLGLTLNDYRFSNDNTIENFNGVVRPVDLNPNGLSKSKLSTSYLTIPVMMEFQFPVSGHCKPFYVSGGLIGGLKLGSHAKVKYHADKSI